jgi:hypothetical protein
MWKNILNSPIKLFVILMGTIIIAMLVFGFRMSPQSVQSEDWRTREELQTLDNWELRLEITKLSNNIEHYQRLKQNQLDNIWGLDSSIIEERAKVQHIKDLIYENECELGITYNKDCLSFQKNQ